MFTGIVQAVGKIVRVTPAAAGMRLSLSWGSLSAEDVAVGDSIAINGACMTVVACDAHHFEVDVSEESLACTHGLNQTGPVNLEKAMRASDRLGGHLVSGHVDGLGQVVSIKPVGESWALVIDLPIAMANWVVEKGSITVQGVSLTINSVSDLPQAVRISINLIPHTWQVTSLHDLKPQSLVNIECDQIAKQVARVLERIKK